MQTIKHVETQFRGKSVEKCCTDPQHLWKCGQLIHRKREKKDLRG